MNFDDAKILAKGINLNKATSVIVSSCGQVYVDGNIRVLEENAEKNKRHLFFIKGEPTTKKEQKEPKKDSK